MPQATELANSAGRIAIMVGSGHVPGINAVIKGAALSAKNVGRQLIGIRDGFDGLLYPDRYPDGGLLAFTPEMVETMDPTGAGLIGQAPRVDPFHVRRVNDDGMVEEVDMSGDLLNRLRAENVDALIAVVGGRGLSIISKLHRKGLNAVCIPRSIENEIAATAVSFGFNSALSFTIEMLDRVRQAAQSARKVAVVEVLGEQAGWIALQAGIAVGADVVLIPEIPCDLKAVAARLQDRMSTRRPFAMVVVAEGARFMDNAQPPSKPSSLKASLSPLAAGEASDFVIRRSGHAADTVATGLQLLMAEETFPLVLGPWVRGGAPTAVDRQLALAYGVGAVQAIQAGDFGSMVAFVPPDVKFVPLMQSINKIRTVPADSEFMKIAHSLGILLGRES